VLVLRDLLRQGKSHVLQKLARLITIPEVVDQHRLLSMNSVEAQEHLVRGCLTPRSIHHFLFRNHLYPQLHLRLANKFTQIHTEVSVSTHPVRLAVKRPVAQSITVVRQIHIGLYTIPANLHLHLAPALVRM
jgi:hypothetical protein